MKNSFKTLTFPELKAKRDELARKYMDFRFQMIIGHVDNPLQKRQLRRQIARLNTLIHRQELAQKEQAEQTGAAGSPSKLASKA
jgi:large subunit ribosomal protein L29